MNRYTQLKSTKTLRDDLAKLQKCLPEKGYDSLKQIATVQIKSLSVQYPNGERITYPDFELKNGEKVLLTGDSGTGKSTLLKVLLGQIKPSTGEVIYCDKTGKKIKPDLRQLGYLAQDLLIFPGSIQENITMFKPKLNKKTVQVIHKTVFDSDQARLKNGIETQLDPQQELLSGGQKQKVVLMRALLHEKPILYLDEATSAIDQQATTKIFQNLMQSRATILAVAHNLTVEQRALFDREVHLEGK